MKLASLLSRVCVSRRMTWVQWRHILASRAFCARLNMSTKFQLNCKFQPATSQVFLTYLLLFRQITRISDRLPPASLWHYCSTNVLLINNCIWLNVIDITSKVLAPGISCTWLWFGTREILSDWRSVTCRHWTHSDHKSVCFFHIRFSFFTNWSLPHSIDKLEQI